MSDDRSGAGARPYAVEVLELLHPTGRVTAGRAAAHDRYVVLPNERRPRLVLPAGHRVAAGRAAFRQVSGPGLRTRALQAGATLSALSGLADLFAPSLGVLHPTGTSSPVVAALAELLDRDDFLITIPVSPPRATRKPVLQLTDRTGGAIAFVKVGHDDLTRTLVRREAGVLRALAPAPAALEVPRLLGVVEQGPLVLMALSPVRPGRARLGREQARASLMRTVDAIAGCGDRGLADLSASPHVRALRLSLSGADADETHRALLTSLEAVVGRLGAVPVGGSHGDLNPGNVALGRRKAVVWDWERFEPALPLGFDLLHHALTSDVASGRPHAQAARSLVQRADLVLGPTQHRGQAHDVARLYLCTIGARYLLDRQEAAGATAGRVSEWVLPAVQAPPQASADATTTTTIRGRKR